MKIVVAVAPVGPAEIGSRVDNPLTPEEIAEQVISCALAGASMVHLHVRDERGEPTADLTPFGRTLSLIRGECDIIIQGSTGGVSTLSLEERCVALGDPRLAVGSLNKGSVKISEGVYVNTLPDIRYWAGRMREEGVRPELEIFEGGMIHNVALLGEEGVLTPPFSYGLALGFRGALPATPQALTFLSGLLPAGAGWGIVHHGMRDLSLLAMAGAMGAAPAVGFEIRSTMPPAGRRRTRSSSSAWWPWSGHGAEVATPAEARDALPARRRALGGETMFEPDERLVRGR